MIKLKAVKLKNFVVYKDMLFKPRKGISIIRGKNASGKSLVGCVLPITFWEHPIADKKLKTEGTSEVIFQTNDIEFDVSKTTGKSTKYTILKNGKDLQLTTIKESEKIIQNSFNISPEYFWNCCYLSSSRPNAVQFASPTERLVLLTKLFNLNIYENIHSKIKDLLKEKKLAKQQKDIFEAEKTGLEKQATKPDLQRYNTLKENYSKLKTRISKIENIEKENQKYLTIKNLCKLPFNLKKTTNLLSKLSSKLSSLKIEKEKYSKNLENYKLFKESLNYKNCLDKLTLKKLSLEFNDINTDKIAENEEWLRKRVITLNLEKYRGKEPAIQSKLSLLKDQLKKLDILLGKGICPTCGQKLTKKHSDNERQELIEEIAKYEKHLKIARMSTEYLQHKDAVWCSSKTHKFLTEFIQEELERSQKAKDFKNVKKVAKPEKPDLSKIEEYEEKYDKLQKHEDLLKELSKLKYVEVESSVKIKKVFNKVFEELTSLKIQKEKYQDVKDRLEELDSQISELDTEDLELLEILLEAYGNKGIKSKQIDVILDTYCLKLNEFSQFLYNGKYRFFHKTDGNKCEIFVERNGKVGDISTLSGFETRAYQMINCLSLICMLGIKLDTLFLDEMENGMSEVALQKFTSEFLPQLKRYIPKIVIITPRSKKELFVSDAYEYEVVKKNNKSEVIQK